MMKKVYEKPSAYIQDMSVNGFVAGACGSAGSGVGVINYSETTCYYYDAQSGLTFFSYQCKDESGFGIDIVNPNSHSPYAQICYHRPLDVLNFFSS